MIQSLGMAGADGPIQDDDPNFEDTEPDDDFYLLHPGQFTRYDWDETRKLVPAFERLGYSFFQSAIFAYVEYIGSKSQSQEIH